MPVRLRFAGCISRCGVEVESSEDAADIVEASEGERDRANFISSVNSSESMSDNGEPDPGESVLAIVT